MRYAILADIHANLSALTAVLTDMGRRGEVAEIWCLGDIVGYGPDPRECIELLRRYQHISVAGNHDWGAIGKLDVSGFNPDAAWACRWTGEQISAEDADYLAGLPLMVTKGEFTLVHGSPREPLHEYLISSGRAEQSMDCFSSRYCLVGHSHLPLVFRYEKNNGIVLGPLTRGIELAKAESRLIINPGSVGQPRDNDPRASYAIYDSEARRIEKYRVSYDISIIQVKMIRKAMPLRLVTRLDYGQ